MARGTNPPETEAVLFYPSNFTIERCGRDKKAQRPEYKQNQWLSVDKGHANTNSKIFSTENKVKQRNCGFHPVAKVVTPPTAKSKSSDH